MRRLFGATVTAALSLAGSATAGVVNFEDYSVGEVVNGPLTGMPHPNLSAKGYIGLDANAAIGNYLALDLIPGRKLLDSSFRQTWTWAGPNLKYKPTLLSIDVFAVHPSEVLGIGVNLVPGEWTTIPLNIGLGGGGEVLKFRGGPIYIDNLVYEDLYVAVPEPSTWAMMIIGFGAAGVAVRSRRRRASPTQCGT